MQQTGSTQLEAEIQFVMDQRTAIGAVDAGAAGDIHAAETPWVMLRPQTVEINATNDMMSVTTSVEQIQIRGALPHVMRRWLVNCVNYPMTPDDGHSRRPLELYMKLGSIETERFGGFPDENQVAHLSLGWIYSDGAIVTDCLLLRFLFYIYNTGDIGSYPACVGIVAIKNSSSCLAYSDFGGYWPHRWSMGIYSDLYCIPHLEY